MLYSNVVARYLCAENFDELQYSTGAEQLHDFVLFAVNTGLRPDEAWRLEFRDVTGGGRRRFGPDDPGDCSTRQARRRILQQYARCREAL